MKSYEIRAGALLQLLHSGGIAYPQIFCQSGFAHAADHMFTYAHILFQYRSP